MCLLLEAAKNTSESPLILTHGAMAPSDEQRQPSMAETGHQVKHEQLTD